MRFLKGIAGRAWRKIMALQGCAVIVHARVTRVSLSDWLAPVGKKPRV